MSTIFITLIIAVAIEAAVIVGLVIKFHNINTPRRVVYEEPMPWMEERE
jgi:hypothetical protein